MNIIDYIIDITTAIILVYLINTLFNSICKRFSKRKYNHRFPYNTHYVCPSGWTGAEILNRLIHNPKDEYILRTFNVEYISSEPGDWIDQYADVIVNNNAIASPKYLQLETYTTIKLDMNLDLYEQVDIRPGDTIRVSTYTTIEKIYFLYEGNVPDVINSKLDCAMHRLDRLQKKTDYTFDAFDINTNDQRGINLLFVNVLPISVGSLDGMTKIGFMFDYYSESY